MKSYPSTLPQFVCDLLASPPQRGEGLNVWFYRTARVLHPFRNSAEITELLRAATFGEPVKVGEIERAVERSKARAWKPGQAAQSRWQSSAWPKLNAEQREAVIASGGELIDLWETSPVRFEDGESHTEEIIDVLFPGKSTFVRRSKQPRFCDPIALRVARKIAGTATDRPEFDDGANRANAGRQRIGTYS